MPNPDIADDRAALVVYGGGGHGKTLIELVAAASVHRVVGVVDPGLEPGTEVLGIPVLGGDEALASVRSKEVAFAVNGVGGIARMVDRVGASERLAAAGFASPVLVHPSAVVEPSARLAPGAQVLAHAYVGTDARIGRGVILNTGAVVSHDCELAEHVTLSPGAMLAGGVSVGTRTLIGMGATVNIGLRIGRDVLIGNSAVVKTDVPDGSVVRAGSVWPLRGER